MQTSTEILHRMIGYRFSNETLLNIALTHRSAKSNNNERLEFLGDSVLGLLMTVALYDKYPGCDEGVLTRCRARLVRQETLANIARANQLGSVIVLGEGAARSGAADRSSILADVLESLIGAIYLESGLEGAGRVVNRLFSDEWDAIHPDTLDKDPKTELQEQLQKIGRKLPIYKVKGSLGEPHNRQFIVECILDEPGGTFQGQGASRRKAEQKAACLALKHLEL